MKGTPQFCRLRGMTLIETLVVFAIIGVLASILLPALGAARESTRRADCASRLRQIGIAVANYETAWNALPPRYCESVGTLPHPYSAHCRLLPFVDAEQVYAALNLNVPAPFVRTLPADHANFTVCSSKIKTFLCPSDGTAVAKSNSFRFCIGIGPYWQGGVLYGNRTDEPLETGLRRRSPRDFVDGTSKTALASERLVGDFSDESLDLQRDAIPLIVGPTSNALQPFLGPCAESAKSPIAIVKHYSWHGATWMMGSATMTTYIHAFTPNSISPDCGSSGDAVIFPIASTARSNHPGGVHLLMADGSLGFVRDSIDPAAWIALGTCQGSETSPF